MVEKDVRQEKPAVDPAAAKKPEQERKLQDKELGQVTGGARRFPPYWHK